MSAADRCPAPAPLPSDVAAAVERIRDYLRMIRPETHHLGEEIAYWPRSYYALTRPDVESVLAELDRLTEAGVPELLREVVKGRAERGRLRAAWRSARRRAARLQQRIAALEAELEGYRLARGPQRPEPGTWLAVFHDLTVELDRVRAERDALQKDMASEPRATDGAVSALADTVRDAQDDDGPNLADCDCIPDDCRHCYHDRCEDCGGCCECTCEADAETGGAA